MLTEQNSIVVDDDPESVAEGVSRAIDGRFDPRLIREEAISLIRRERVRFVEFLADLVAPAGAGEDVKNHFNSIFCHKLLEQKSIRETQLEVRCIRAALARTK